MKIFLSMVFLFYLNIAIVFSKEPPPNYDGEAIDLMTFHATKLYKGPQKLFIADDLNVKDIYELTSSERNTWQLSVNFTIKNQLAFSKDTWLQLRSNVNASTIWINGHLLLTNGQIGTDESNEISGKGLVIKHIPSFWLKQGINNLDIRFSNFKQSDSTVFKDVSLGSLEAFHTKSLIMSTAPLVLSGLFLFAIITNIGLYFAMNKKRVFISLIVLFSCCLLLMVNETLYWNGLSQSNGIFNQFINLIEHCIIMSFVIVMCYHYDMPLKKMMIFVILYIGLALTCHYLFSVKAFLLSPYLIFLSLYARKRQYKNSTLLLCYVIFLTIIIYLDVFNILDNQQWIHSNFILTSFVYKMDKLTVALFALIMIVLTAGDILRNSLSLHKTKNQLNTLQFQFINKHIQPHFLVNTLMSLQQLIKTDHVKAIELVDALSEEFYLMTEMMKLSEVPIVKEIAMCRYYLTIMSLQHKTNHEFKVEGICGDELIPPALFHTIIENGLTHGYTGSEPAVFSLTKYQNKYKCTYVLSNDGHQQSVAKNKPSMGSGMDYLESRLRQWHPGQYKLKTFADHQGWHTVIELK